MQRKIFIDHFGITQCAVFVVIHVLDIDQTQRNISLAMASGASGVFLINHDFDVDTFLPIIESARAAFPDTWIGVNFLAVTGKYAFPILADLERKGCRVDGYWGDDARIDESREVNDQPEAAEILQIKQQCGWQGLYFGGTAFKKQREVDAEDFFQSAEIASHWMDVVTTSGVATGKEPGVDKVDVFRSGVQEHALALASGVSPENIHIYRHNLDAVLVATSINRQGDFYNIDGNKLEQLMQRINQEEQQ